MCNSKKWISILAAVVITGGVLSGCITQQAADTGTSQSTSASSETTSQSEQTSGATGTTLELFYQKSNTNVIQTLIDKFEKENPDIKIELTATSSDTGKQIFQTRMATNEPMDLVQHWPSQAEFQAMCREGRMYDISSYEWNKNIIETYYNLSSIDGKLYSVPLSINVGVVAYNKDIFEQNGVSVPNTWNELIAACETLKAVGVAPMIFSNGDKENCSQKFHIMTAAVANDSWNPYDFYVGMYQGNGKTFADDQGFTALAAERLYELSSKYSAGDSMSINYDLSMQMFANGEGAMMITGTWAQSDIQKNNPDINMGMFGLPTDNGVNMLITGIDPCIAAMSGTGKEEQAAKFLEFISKTENAQIYTDFDRSPSPIKGVVTDNPTINLVLEFIGQGNAIPWWRDYISTGVISDEADLAQEFLMDGNVEKFVAGEEEIVLRQN